jgi:hypothetical protein
MEKDKMYREEVQGPKVPASPMSSDKVYRPMKPGMDKPMGTGMMSKPMGPGMMSKPALKKTAMRNAIKKARNKGNK